MMAGGPPGLVLIGDGEFAEIADEYFTHDSPWDVVGFAVEGAYRHRDELFGLPVVDFESMEKHYPAETHRAFVAITNTQLNRVRTRLLAAVRERGYSPVSYVSSRAFVWRNACIGENCFVFENNVIQYHVRLEDNVVLWSGNHVGHRSVIRENCFVTSHAVISGYCDVGASSFIGVNACLADHVKVGADCILGMGSVVVRDTEVGKVYVGNPAKPLEKSSYDTFQVPEALR
jgi:sugar O-acyltransferase (sialic acid O-acetyltransferase NeuD family)